MVSGIKEFGGMVYIFIKLDFSCMNIVYFLNSFKMLAVVFFFEFPNRLRSYRLLIINIAIQTFSNELFYLFPCIFEYNDIVHIIATH